MLGAVLLAGCWSSGSTPGTKLSIERHTGRTTKDLRQSDATLRCGTSASATGFLSKTPGSACALVHRGTLQKVTAKQRTKRACTAVSGGPQRAHITGTINGHHVDLTVTRADGCGTSDWQALAPLLGNPEGASRPSGATTTTTAPPIRYRVKPGDTLTILSRRFGITIATIVRVNHLANPDHLADGQQLLIPPVPPIELVVTPAKAKAGTSFRFALTGAKPFETVTFEIDSPDGKYRGPPHSPAADGVVSATYNSAAGDTPGNCTVIARGSQGTTAQAHFRIESATATTAPL